MKSFYFIFIFLLFGNLQSFAQKTDYKAYAVYLMSFVKYSDWGIADQKEIKVMVWGKSKVFDELSLLASKPQASGKKIVVFQSEQPSDALNYHLVFVTDSKSSQLKNLATLCKQKPILIIAEREGLAKKGAAIHFTVSEDEDLGFEVNNKELAVQKIKIAQRLLQLGKTVD